MKDLKFLDMLKTGDHEFMPGAIAMVVVPKHKLAMPESAEIDARWKDFAAEKESRGLKAADGDLVLTRMATCIKRGPLLYVDALFGKFKPWVTTRPAFTYSDGGRPGPLEGMDIYSLGSGALLFAKDKDALKYVVFGSRHWREIGGEIDTPPAGFLKAADFNYLDPALTGFRREAVEEVIEPDEFSESGIMKSDYWRNLTAIYDAGTEMKNLEQLFDLQEEGEVVVLKRKAPRTSKYGEGGLFMVPIGKLDSYVSGQLDRHGDGRFGERAALLLKRYFKRI